MCNNNNCSPKHLNEAFKQSTKYGLLDQVFESVWLNIVDDDNSSGANYINDIDGSYNASLSYTTYKNGDETWCNAKLEIGKDSKESHRKVNAVGIIKTLLAFIFVATVVVILLFSPESLLTMLYK